MNYKANINEWGANGPPGLSPAGWLMGVRNPTSSTWYEGIENFGEWKLSSAGPDKEATLPFIESDLIYDPTNGTVSRGDILRTQREPETTQKD